MPADRLGISRQAAWERFGGEEVALEKKRRKTGAGVTDRRVIVQLGRSTPDPR
ncbi:MAG: hypothetical protein ACRDU5_22210 [Mycobacterium sp.]